MKGNMHVMASVSMIGTYLPSRLTIGTNDEVLGNGLQHHLDGECRCEEVVGIDNLHVSTTLLMSAHHC